MSNLRFHLPALPGRSLDKEQNPSCAYSNKLRKFVLMMEARGHECFVYEAGGPPLPFESEQWLEPNLRIASEIQGQKEPGDFLGIIGGVCQQSIANAHPDLMAVEYGIGYSGTFTNYRVFESYAWMHMVYGHSFPNPMSDRGHFYDTVIPNYFEVDDFPLGSGGDYLLYVGRLIENKGIEVAEETAKKLGLDLIIAGPKGDYEPSYGDYVGEVGPKARAELMGGAKALFCPTLYIEPFGGVAVEAQLCGTPVICTDWGGFTETVRQGESGYRCRSLGEFIWAVEHAGNLDRQAIRTHAITNYSTEAIAPRYERYFEHLQTLYGDGWYSEIPVTLTTKD